MLIDTYELELFTPPCKPDAETWCVIAHLETDISEVLPYLNATLPGAIYNPAAQALIWKKGKRGFAFRPGEIAASNLVDRTEAEQVAKELIQMVNQTWERRSEIEPDFEIRQRLTPMAVFKLLPGTNCTQCGQATCFNFALKVTANQQNLDACRPLFQPEFAVQLAQLQVMVMEAPDIN